jgi:HEAT repeat protein
MENQSDISTWIEALRDPLPAGRLQAIDALKRCGPRAREARPALIEVLSTASTSECHLVIKALDAIGLNWEEDRAWLLGLLESRDKGLRQHAAILLIRLGAVVMPSMAEVVQNGGLRARMQASEILGQLGPEARPALPAIIEFYQFLQTEQKNAICRIGLRIVISTIARIMRDDLPALSQIIPISDKPPWYPYSKLENYVIVNSLAEQGSRLLPTLIKALEIEDLGVQCLAQEALRKLSPDIAPALLKLATDENPVKRASGVWALNPEHHFDVIAAALDDESFEVRMAALTRLDEYLSYHPHEYELPRYKFLLPQLMKALQEPLMRGLACDILQHFEELPASATPFVVEELKKGHGYLGVLEKIGPAAAEALPELKRLFLRFEYTKPGLPLALAKIGPVAWPFIDEMLESPEAQYRNRALEVIKEMGPEAGRFIPALIRLLEIPERDVQMHALWTLASLGKMAASAMPTLIALADENKRELNLGIILVLREIGTAHEDAIPLLIRFLNDGAEGERIDAAHALGGIRPASQAIASALIEALQSEMCRLSDSLSSAVISSLTFMGENAAQALPLIAEWLSDDRSQAYSYTRAKKALGELAKKIPSSFDLLAKLTRDPKVRLARPYLLEIIGKMGAIAIPALMEALSDEDKQVQQAAIKMLGRLGPAAAGAVPVLRQLRLTAGKRIRKELDQALIAILCRQEARGGRSQGQGLAAQRLGLMVRVLPRRASVAASTGEVECGPGVRTGL